MSEGVGWAAMRERRMAEPGAAEAYDAARLAFELGRSVRELRERRGWSQTQLAKASGMTQSAVARFEAGGTVPTLLVLERLGSALHMPLRVGFEPGGEAALPWPLAFQGKRTTSEITAASSVRRPAAGLS